MTSTRRSPEHPERPDRHEAGVTLSRARSRWNMPPRATAAYALAVVMISVIVMMAETIRGAVDPVATGFGLLVLVVACVSLGGLGPGIAASLLGFGVFNFYFLPPFETLAVEKAHDLIVLFVFLGLSVLISVLVARADSRARSAEGRAEELRRQQELSRILVESEPGPRPYDGILRVVVATFGFLDGLSMSRVPPIRAWSSRRRPGGSREQCRRAAAAVWSDCPSTSVGATSGCS